MEKPEGASEEMKLSESVGCIFDSDMIFFDEINAVLYSVLYSQILSFSCISAASVEFVIFSGPLSAATDLANSLVSSKLDTVIHYTLAFQKQISTNFNAFKTHWHVSSQTHQNVNISHQHSKNYICFQSNEEKESAKKLRLLTYKAL